MRITPVPEAIQARMRQIETMVMHFTAHGTENLPFIPPEER